MTYEASKFELYKLQHVVAGESKFENEYHPVNYLHIIKKALHPLWLAPLDDQFMMVVLLILT